MNNPHSTFEYEYSNDRSETSSILSDDFLSNAVFLEAILEACLLVFSLTNTHQCDLSHSPSIIRVFAVLSLGSEGVNYAIKQLEHHRNIYQQ